MSNKRAFPYNKFSSGRYTKRRRFEPQINLTNLEVQEYHYSNLTFDDLSALKDELLQRNQCLKNDAVVSVEHDTADKHKSPISIIKKTSAFKQETIVNTNQINANSNLKLESDISKHFEAKDVSNTDQTESDSTDATTVDSVQFNIIIPDDSSEFTFHCTTKTTVKTGECSIKQTNQSSTQRKVMKNSSEFEKVNHLQTECHLIENSIKNLTLTPQIQIKSENNSTCLEQNETQNIHCNNNYYGSDSSDDDKDEVRTNRRLQTERHTSDNHPKTPTMELQKVQKASDMWVSVLNGPELPKEIIKENFNCEYENNLEYQELLKVHLLTEDKMHFKMGESPYERMLAGEHGKPNFIKWISQYYVSPARGKSLFIYNS